MGDLFPFALVGPAYHSQFDLGTPIGYLWARHFEAIAVLVHPFSERILLIGLGRCARGSCGRNSFGLLVRAQVSTFGELNHVIKIA